jgi:hypothetical protein
VLGQRLCHGARMAILFGDKRKFAVEVGGWTGPALRQVDLWAADQWLTCDDNMVFVPQFHIAVANSLNWLRAGHHAAPPFVGSSAADAHLRLVAGTGREEEDDAQRRRFRFFNGWGPPTDNVTAFLFRDGNHLVMTCQFWREEHLLEHPAHVGAVFAAEISAGELAEVLEDLIAVLSADRNELTPGADAASGMANGCVEDDRGTRKDDGGLPVGAERRGCA